MKWLKKLTYKKRSAKVAEYYDKWSRDFVTLTDTLQGFRTEDINETHAYTIQQAMLANGQTILDAGCGVGGPAFYFAENLKSDVHGVTISGVQVEIMKERATATNRTNIFPVKGDYHHLPDYFKPAFFDRILFLESLGHSYHPAKVFEGCYQVMKPGGILYVRDHYVRPDVTGEELQKVKALTAEADETYVYNHSYLDDTLRQIKEAGFEVQMVQKPQLTWWNINIDMEKRFGVKSPNGYFIDTYEIRAVKK